MLGRILSFFTSLLAGWLLGWVFLNDQWPGQGAPWGVVLGALCWFALDFYRSLRVVRWLTKQPPEVPTTWGIWGEVVDRVRRLIRLKDRQHQLSQENLEQFLAAIQASPNGVLMLDHEWRITWCNTMAAQHLGIDPVRDLAQLIGNLVRNPDFNRYLQSGDHQSPVVIDGREHRPDNPQRLSLQLFTYGRNRHLLLSQDITAIEHSEAMRRDFVANVSHEIRTPLTVLAGFVETLQNLSLTPDQQSNYLELMARQAHRMQTLVEDLLTLSRLEGSPLPGLEPTPMVIFWSSLQEEALALDQAMSVTHGGVHAIDFLCKSDVQDMLLGQKIEIQSAMSNLVANAVRYTPAGGRIEVSWGINDAGDGVFSVQDSGPGIAPEHLPRITERFYRVDRSRSRETGGTGLGLAIVKHVVQRHGGEMVIESTVGQGSRFAIIWPASRIKRSRASTA
jgi:two-component system phosphate regulon sensor histidine kinase PhoR